MKKIIAFVSIAVVAAASQAATLKWTANNIKDSKGNPISGGVAYLLATTGTTGDGTSGYTKYTTDGVAKDIADGKFTGAGAIASTATGGSGQLSKAGIGSYGAGDTVTAFFVVFDGPSIAESKNFVISNGTISQTYTSTTGEKAFTFGNMSTGSFAQSSWTAIPEPTTVALLALGLAALGLKRKVA